MSDVDMSEEDANFLPNPDSQQDLLDRITQLEHRLKNTLDSNDFYQNQIDKLIRKILELYVSTENAVDTPRGLKKGHDYLILITLSYLYI